MLRKQKALTLMVVLTLAIGVGANGAIFALVDRCCCATCRYRSRIALVTIWEQTETTPKGQVSPLNLVDWMQRNQSFDAIGGVVRSPAAW